jgi:hypothetical protein
MTLEVKRTFRPFVGIVSLRLSGAKANFEVQELPNPACSGEMAVIYRGEHLFREYFFHGDV